MIRRADRPPRTTLFFGVQNLRTAHAVAAIVAEIAISVSNGDRTAIVAGRRIELEIRKLILPIGRTRIRIDSHGNPCSFKESRC